MRVCYNSKMKYVVFRQGGKQYTAKEGEILNLEGVKGEGKELLLEDILFYASDGDYKIGFPKVEGVKIRATVLGDKRQKIRVSKFKSKVRTRRVTGHKREFKIVKIDQIIAK